MKRLLLFLVLALVLFAAWDMYLATHEMPHRTTLTDKSGNTIQVDILAASPEQVDFLLRHNNKQYTWPTEKLDFISRYKVRRLIQSSKKADAAKTTAPPTHP